MLMKIEELVDLLKSPVGTERLVFSDDRQTLRSVGTSMEYSVVENIPVLVDFDNSVLNSGDIDFQGVGSPISRPKYGGIGNFLHRVVNRKSTVTQRNVRLIKEHLSGLDSPVVLLVGGGTIGEGMEFLKEDQNIKLVSFDIYGTDNTQFVADAHSIPVIDEAIDCVIIQAVLEHVISPNTVVAEIHRVLKSDGIVYAETPFMQQVHEGAFDFTRYTDSGHRGLFGQFEALGSGAVSGPGTALLWSIDYFVRSLFRSRAAGKFAKLLFFWLQYADVLIGENYSIDAASAVYFYGRKSAVSKFDSTCWVEHYRGAQ